MQARKCVGLREERQKESGGVNHTHVCVFVFMQVE